MDFTRMLTSELIANYAVLVTNRYQPLLLEQLRAEIDRRFPLPRDPEEVADEKWDSEDGLRDRATATEGLVIERDMAIMKIERRVILAIVDMLNDQEWILANEPHRRSIVEQISKLVQVMELPSVKINREQRAGVSMR